MQIAANKGDLRGMKRTISVAFCIIVLFSMALLANTGTVKASKAGYSMEDYIATITPTMDGQWTTTDEWADTTQVSLDGSLDAIARAKYVSNYPTSVDQYFLIEFFSDTTNDPGDYWQLCYAASATLFGTPIGGTTPQTDCLMINYTGHSSSTTLTVFKGTGTGWSVFTDYTVPTHVQLAESISVSPLSGTPHWIVEIKVEHIHFNIMPEFWVRLAAYDASNSAAGVQAWPEGSADVPNDYGLLSDMQAVIPETFPIVVVLVLSSVAVIVGSRYFRKETKIKSCNQGKLAK